MGTEGAVGGRDALVPESSRGRRQNWAKVVLRDHPGKCRERLPRGRQRRRTKSNRIPAAGGSEQLPCSPRSACAGPEEKGGPAAVTETRRGGMREAELVLNASPPLTELSADGAAGADPGRAPKGAEREAGGGPGRAPRGIRRFHPLEGCQRSVGRDRSGILRCGTVGLRSSVAFVVALWSVE